MIDRDLPGTSWTFYVVRVDSNTRQQHCLRRQDVNKEDAGKKCQPPLATLTGQMPVKFIKEARWPHVHGFGAYSPSVWKLGYGDANKELFLKTVMA